MQSAWSECSAVLAGPGWQLAQVAAATFGLPACGVWQERHGAVAWCSAVWQVSHATALAIVWECGGWQPTQLPIGWVIVFSWHEVHGRGVSACGEWQVVQVVCLVAASTGWSR